MKIFYLIASVLLLTGCASDDKNYIGYKYLGADYLADPLGEGVLPDTDPRIREDAFDCVTFVETSIADGKLNKLNKIRYKNAEVDFLSRNHFIESDWLKNNADLLENISSKFADTKIRNVIIDKQNWMKKVHNVNAEFQKQEVNLEYIPYDKLGYIKTDTPLVVLFITGKSKKSDIIGTDLAVVHMGFLLPNGMLRHASSKYGRVVDENFYEYVTKRTENKNNIGITLVEIK